MLRPVAAVLALCALATAAKAKDAREALLRDWTSVVSSGDRGAVYQFTAARYVGVDEGTLPIQDVVSRDMKLHRTSGGLDVRRILASSGDAIRALLRTRLARNWIEATLVVDDAGPPKILAVRIRPVATPRDELVGPQPTDGEIAARATKLMQRLAEADAFSGVVVVARDGEPIFTHASGLAHRGWQVPNALDTRFNLSSITKMFTAVAIAQLVERGRLDYDDAVGKLLPDYPNPVVAEHVTVRHLLSHTSGMIDARRSACLAPRPLRPRTTHGMLAAIVDEPLSFRPGQQMQYSDAGYVLLGAVIEETTGQMYFNYVRSHIFKQAGMKDADFLELDADPPRVATGYKDALCESRQSNIFDLAAVGSPAGMSYATAEDLVRFQQALVGGKLGSQESLNELWTPAAEAPDGSRYGLGAQLETINGLRIVGHGGGGKGVANRFEMYPDAGVSVVILSNYDADAVGVAHRFREWFAPRAGDPMQLACLRTGAAVHDQSCATACSSATKNYQGGTP